MILPWPPTVSFQSTRPRGARRQTRKPTTASCWCFNPRAREGRDLTPKHRKTALLCFNPRAREGRDISQLMQLGTVGRFQSTRPRGARHFARSTLDDEIPVSIHAPARGATSHHFGCLITTQGFNPRAREGRDLLKLCRRILNSLFQSTRPRGARLPPAPPTSVEPQFQSTRPRGARLSTPTTPQADGWFQSTRPRGARPLYANRLNPQRPLLGFR